LIKIDAIDIFVESDSSDGDGEDGPKLISVRVPQDREFARQIKELGGKWDDQAKEWRLYGSDDLLKQVADMCKQVFPKLSRRKNRLVAAQVSTTASPNWVDSEVNKEATPTTTTRPIELVAEVQFVVNRTLKNYRVGQPLKWAKEFKQIIEVATTEQVVSRVDTEPQQAKFAEKLLTKLPDLERLATEAFEALLAGRKEAVSAILKEAGISQK
jgi:hypothetical protein